MPGDSGVFTALDRPLRRLSVNIVKGNFCMYEHRTHPYPRYSLFTNVLPAIFMSALIILTLAWGSELSVTITWGELGWLDALLNASMILGWNGTFNPLQPAGKLFASGYALFSGLAFIGVASLLRRHSPTVYCIASTWMKNNRKV